MITIIDYGMGNVRSVENALRYLGVASVLSSAHADIEQGSHLILPGVGAFPDGMSNLKKRGLVPVLEKEVFRKKKPFLGICLGMQLMAEDGEEGGVHKGLGWISGTVRRFRVDTKKFRIPHVGWNDVAPKEHAVLFRGISPPIFYFVHSFFLVPTDPNTIAATCTYGEGFTAAVQKENIFGTQFHPEKSQKSGLAVLRNFLNL